MSCQQIREVVLTTGTDDMDRTAVRYRPIYESAIIAPMTGTTYTGRLKRLDSVVAVD